MVATEFAVISYNKINKENIIFQNYIIDLINLKRSFEDLQIKAHLCKFLFCSITTKART